MAPRTVHAAPPAPSAPAPTHARAVTGARPSGHGGGLNLPVPSGGGKGDELVVLAVIVAVVAVMAATGLIVTEGVRFDGFVAMAPAQPLHLQDRAGGERVVTLGDLSREDAAYATGALVMDDEGWGLHRLDRGPLRRRGLAFKLDAGMAEFAVERYAVTGLASHVQAGGFFSNRFGVMLDVGLAGATDAEGKGIARHSLGLEAQAFPVIAGPLSLGLYAKVGEALAAGPSFSDSGLLGGGGALLELALTARLALTLRAGWTAARLDTVGWSQGGTATAGVAIY
jgi:hypothetical protein